jgi:methionyl-tRNA formyltransferase
MMRIAIMGQAAFGAEVLKNLTDRGEEVIAAWLPQGKPGTKPDPLRVAAESRHIPVYQPASYKSPDAFSQFQASMPDLLIMAFVTDIIPHTFISAPPKGAICYHPSLLPRHRGGSAINWALIMGDKETGLSIFWTDADIDTGPILLQKRTPIGPEETTGSLYFNRLYPLGIEAIAESVALIKTGQAPRLIQDERLATYEPLCNDQVAQINWERSAAEIHNLIRGCDPQPGAYTFHQGRKIRCFDARLADAVFGAVPGELLAKNETGFTVATGDRAIRIGKVKTEAGKQDAALFAEQAGLNPGDRFIVG